MEMNSPTSNFDTFIDNLKSEFLLQEYQQLNVLLEAHFKKTDSSNSTPVED